MTADARTLAQHHFALLARGLGGDRTALGDFAGAFAADGVLWLPPAPDTPSQAIGPQPIHSLLLGRLAPSTAPHPTVQLFQMLGPDADAAQRFAFQFEYRDLRPDGSAYLDSPTVVLSLRGEQIAGCWEYRGGPRFFADSPGPGAAPDGEGGTARALAERAFLALQQGLAGERERMGEFVELLAEDVRLWFPPTPNTTSPYVGRAAAAALFRDFLGALYPDGLFVRRYHTLTGGGRTAFELQSFGIRRDGSEYINSPMLSMDVSAGRITRIWEHWGSPGCFDAALRSRTTG